MRGVVPDAFEPIASRASMFPKKRQYLFAARQIGSGDDPLADRDLAIAPAGGNRGHAVGELDLADRRHRIIGRPAIEGVAFEEDAAGDPVAVRNIGKEFRQQIMMRNVLRQCRVGPLIPEMMMRIANLERRLDHLLGHDGRSRRHILFSRRVR